MSAKPTISVKALFQNHGLLIIAGFFLLFFSSFGQTVFIGVFLPDIMPALDITRGEVSLYYAIATLASAGLLIFTGKLLDIFDERFVLCAALCGLAVGCVSLSFAYTPVMVVAAFFLLRQCGQGLLPVTSSTCINRYITLGRGRAASYAGLGVSAHIALMPMLALFMIEQVGWRDSYQYFALFVIAFLIPFFMMLLSTHGTRRAVYNEEQTKPQIDTATIVRSMTRLEVLKDVRFHLMLMILLITPAFSTAILFFQSDVAASQGISHAAFIQTFVIMVVFSVIGKLGCGWLIDHIGEVIVMIAIPILYAAGLSFLIWGSGFIVTAIAISFLGIAGGTTAVSGGPILTALFGAKHLGAIKSMLSALMVLSTAVSPLFGGLLLDAGYSVNFMLLCFFAYVVVAGVILMLNLKRFDTVE